MLIFHNHNLPRQAIAALCNYGETVGFAAPGLVYEAVSGHPDLFIVQAGDELIVVPNIPGNYTQLLDEKAIIYRAGRSPLGFRYPESAKYNAVITEKYFIHNLKITDPYLSGKAGDREKVHVNQGYTRCNLLAMGDTHFITSDKGICKTLLAKGLDVLYVDPKGIELPGFSHGFFGGVCGICQKIVFVTGSLACHPQGEIIRQFITEAGYAVIELYDGPLFDGGSILFVG
ncbi:MAG: DUF6873 family GME fold protein [Bacteroidales bacterium]